jgi:hypothetical protein
MGLSVLLDTNVIISLLKNEEPVLQLVSDADTIIISIINEIEFKSFSNLNEHDLRLFNEFLKHVTIIDLKKADQQLIETIYRLRKKYQIKLPDAIIAATSIVYKSSLITADKGFSKINELKLIQI